MVRFSNTPITSQWTRGRTRIGGKMALSTTTAKSDYYVYVYIDPRSLAPFYFGKGQGSRKNAHLDDIGDSEKARTIADIHKAGLHPMIRVIAKGLTENEAFLIEKTLLWQLGRQVTNVASGHYAENFRPQKTYHQMLSGFDYQAGVYYFNVGECDHRCWDDFRTHGFISAGQGIRWRDAIRGFNEGDVVAAYLKGAGFVGIGKITARARPIREVTLNGLPLLSLPIAAPQAADNIADDDLCEYAASVDWIATTGRSDAKWEPRSRLYTTTHVRASLDGQPNTIAFLEKAFGIKIEDIMA